LDWQTGQKPSNLHVPTGCAFKVELSMVVFPYSPSAHTPKLEFVKLETKKLRPINTMRLPLALHLHQKGDFFSAFLIGYDLLPFVSAFIS
jgi:hypothetical protein